MLELKALLLTQGMHGMVSQVEGLANALKLKFKHQTIKLKQGNDPGNFTLEGVARLKRRLYG